MKLKHLILSAVFLFGNLHLFSQNEDKYMKAIVASDTILHGNSFEFKIIIRNLHGDFTPPSIENFNIIGGPNMSSKMLYNNGELLKESSYSYVLEARKVGEYFIGEVTLTLESEDIQIPPIPILVVENPDKIKKKYYIDEKAKTSFSFPIDSKNLETSKKKVLKKI